MVQYYASGSQKGLLWKATAPALYTRCGGRESNPNEAARLTRFRVWRVCPFSPPPL